jgi:hypothetical protein
LAQNLGQLAAVNRDVHSKYWANLQLLGQRCNFRAIGRRVIKITSAHLHRHSAHSVTDALTAMAVIEHIPMEVGA